jgi:ketosteroid isomerase-like protein
MDAAAASSGSTGTETAGRSEAADFVARFERAWSRSDAGALAELLAADVLLVQPMMPATRGRAEAREAFSRLLRLVPDLHVTVHRWAAGEGVVFIEFTLRGSFGGAEVSWPAVDAFVLRDGLAAERISYFDPLPLAAELARRPRGWRRLVASGFRPSPLASTANPRR